MAHEVNIYEGENIRGKKEFGYNWVNSSRFLFYLQVIITVAFLFGASYKLYTKRYTGKPDVEVQGSSEYTPKYK
jgi:hypothetical protein